MPSTPANAKKPKDHKAKSSFGKRFVFEVEVPSGSVIKMTRPGLQGLIKAGIVDSFDQLTTIVQTETIPKAEGRPVEDIAKKAMESSKDPKKVEEMLAMMDKIAQHVVVEPRLHDVPTLSAEDIAAGKTLDDILDPELAYIHYVDETDKAFIMQAAMGGTTDLERFRQESSQIVGDVPAVEAAADPAE